MNIGTVSWVILSLNVPIAPMYQQVLRVVPLSMVLQPHVEGRKESQEQTWAE
jgi:hypothetical protein